MLKRDFDRALSAFKRVNLSPLGSSAFASTSFNVNREYTSRLLGFNNLVENSMDAVSSRDFAIESIFVSSSILLSLSRIAEEIILWSSEFNFIELPDEFSSSSSIMPQKKNPDIAELIRARAGRVCGNLASAMMIYKAMPFAYNRDFQEINPLLYFSLESAEMATSIMASMLSKIKINKDVLKEKAVKGFTLATEIADMLVQKTGIPFRIAHKIVGLTAMKSDAIQGRNLTKTSNEVSLDLLLKSLLESAKEVCKDSKIEKKYLEKICEIDEKDIEGVINPELALERRKNPGSPSKLEVLRMLNSRKTAVQKDLELVETKVDKISKSLENLYSEVEKILKTEGI
jgi:argininosuccinate lyase